MAFEVSIVTTKITQGLADKVMAEFPAGTQLYDDEVSGLRIVVGKTSASYKLVGFINDGSKRYFSSMVGRTDEISLKTARTRAIDLKQKARQGVDPRRPKSTAPSLEVAFQRFLDGRGRELSPRTVEFYKDKVNGPLSSLKKLPVDKIDREQVRTLHEKLTEKRGPGSANGAMRTLKTIINDAARTHDLPPNPVSRGVRLHRLDPRDWAVSPEEMPKLWAMLDDLDDRVRRGCWLLMLLTGLRSHDARSVRWEHIDADGVLTVPNPKGGERKAFKLPLPRPFLQELEAIRELTKPLESAYVFASAGSVSGHVEGMKRRQEFPYPPHAMRHTFRTFALEAGVDLAMTMVLMNHRPAGVTWGYVTRANLLGPMREAIEKVASKIASYRGRP
jgi:integrase